MTDRIVFLGDSQYDSGEFWRLASMILVDPLPAPPYYAQQFSDGEVQTDVITRQLGFQESYNYAVGGARALGPLTAGDFVDDDEYVVKPGGEQHLQTRIDLTAQVDYFLDDASDNGWTRSTMSGVTVNMLIGINDLSNWEPESSLPWRWDNEIDDLVDDIVDVIELNVRRLLDAGVGEIWVGGQADETFFPIYNDLDLLTELLSEGVIDDLNDRLIDMVASIGDSRVRVMELEEITDAIEEDPSNFGIVDLENSILLGKASSYEPDLNPELPADFDFEEDRDEYGFLDRVHPTEHVHRILGIYQAEVMSSTWTPGSTSNDVFGGTDDDDLIIGVQGDDELNMRMGDDVALGGSDEDRIVGHRGSDLLSGGAGHDYVRGGRDNDLLTGGYGNDHVIGDGGSDVLIDTAGSDTLQGDDGDDFLLWFDGADQGADTLIGGNGSDTLILYIGDSQTYREAVREYDKAAGGGGGGGGGSDKGKGGKKTLAAAADTDIVLTTLGVTIGQDVEIVKFVDVPNEGLELPDTGYADLALRLDEWLHWDFA